MIKRYTFVNGLLSTRTLNEHELFSGAKEVVLAEDYDALARDITAYQERITALNAEAAGWEKYAAEQRAIIAALQSAIQLIGNELDLHADKGPAGEAFRALLTPMFGDDAPELTGEELKRPDAKWRIGGKEVTAEEGWAAFREGLHKRGKL